MDRAVAALFRALDERAERVARRVSEPAEMGLVTDASPLTIRLQSSGIEIDDEISLILNESYIPVLGDQVVVIPLSNGAFYVSTSFSTDAVGGGEGTTYVHNQVAPLATWVIVHNMSRFPAVDVVDSAGTVVIGTIQYTDANTVTLTFSSPFSGTAYLN